MNAHSRVPSWCWRRTRRRSVLAAACIRWGPSNSHRLHTHASVQEQPEWCYSAHICPQHARRFQLWMSAAAVACIISQAAVAITEVCGTQATWCRADVQMCRCADVQMCECRMAPGSAGPHDGISSAPNARDNMHAAACMQRGGLCMHAPAHATAAACGFRGIRAGGAAALPADGARGCACEHMHALRQFRRMHARLRTPLGRPSTPCTG
jgi:hypothetical protein